MVSAPHPQNSSSETGGKPAHEGLDYKEVAREVLAHIDQRLADLQGDDPSHPLEAPFRSQTVSDIVGTDRQAALVRTAWYGLIGLVLSASLAAAMALLWSHKEMVNPSVAQPLPRSDLGSTTPADKPEPGPPAPPAAIAEVTPAQAAPLPRIAPDNDNPKPAPVPPELAALMRKVDRNVAELAQAVTQIRLAQQQAADDNGKIVEDIKASLDRMVRAMAGTDTAKTDTAKTPGQAAPPRLSAPTSRATAPGPRRLVPPAPASDARGSDVPR